MKSSRIIFATLILSAAVFLNACKSSSPPDNPTATPTTQPTISPTPRPTDTPTPKPTATRLPTRTPRPTSTERPRPTATPAGFYSHNQAGFSVAFPSAIIINSENEVWGSFYSEQSGIYFEGMGYPSDPSTTFDTIIDFYYEGATILNRSEKFEILLGKEEITAEAIKFTLQFSNGGRADSQAVFYDSGNRFYFFAMFGDLGFIDAEADAVKSVYNSIALFAPSVFNLPREETLSLLGGDPNLEDLDPHQTTGGASGYVGLLFAGLVRLDQSLNVIPDLAEDWTISPNGQVYTFTLRSDITFADGDKITAEDVIYSWDRAADPDTKSPTVKTYLGDILGVTERYEGTSETISGLKAVNERTLVVTLDAPKPYFLLKLTYPVAFIIDRNDVKNGGEEWMFDPNSSGPYELDEYVETEKLIFTQNRRFHTPPAVRYVGFLLNPGGSAISRYEDGSLDMVNVYGESALRVHRVEDPLHTELHSVPSLCTSYIAMNNTLPPFDDPKVRQAFLLAFDRSTYMKRITRGLDLPALGLLPPAMPGYIASSTVSDHEPEAAKAALAASSYAGNLPEVVLETGGFGGEDDSTVNALADMWRRTLGIDIRVVFLDPINFTEAAREYPAHLTTFGWCADYPDPQNFFEPLFSTGAEFNIAGYSNPQLDDLLAQANIEADRQHRLDLYQQAEKLLLGDFALIPLTHNTSEILVKPRILGYVHLPMDMVFIHDITIGADKP